MPNPTNKYLTPVGLQQPAAADLSDGTTGTGAVVLAGTPTLTGNPIAPTQATTDNSTRIATTAYVTTAIANAVAGVNPAVAVQAATNAILPNSPTYFNGVSGIGATITAGVTNNTLVVDGYTPILNDRILVKNESGGGGLGAGKNGVYFVSQLASLGLAWVLTRALDYDQPSDINNTGAIPVINGTVNTTTQWVLTSSITAVDGTQALTYAQFSANPATLAPLASPAFTGIPTAPTAGGGTNTTQIATTAFVQSATSSVGVDTFNINGSVVVTPFSFTALVNGIGPVGQTNVNGLPVANYRPCMVEVQGIVSSSNGGALQRSAGVVYRNTSPYPILVCVYVFSSNANAVLTAFSDSNPVPTTPVAINIGANVSNGGGKLTFFVLPNRTYEVTVSTGTATIQIWREFICQNGTITQSSDLQSGSARVLGTVYQNNSSNTLFVSVQCSGVSAASTVQAVSDQKSTPTDIIDQRQQWSSGSASLSSFFIVPPYHYYKVTAASGSLSHWYEYTWNINCTKSLDLGISANGPQRQVKAYSASINTGTVTAAMTQTQCYINTDPFRVRWVQLISTNATATSSVILQTDDALPPILFIDNFFNVTTSSPRTSIGPVMPNRPYMAVDTSSGTLTTTHWWEYQLG